MLDEQGQKSLHVDKQTQDMLNTPLDGQLSEKERQFVETLKSLVEKKQIDLFGPSTLLNNVVYGQLSDDAKGKTDYEAMSILQEIRQIIDLVNLGHMESMQMKYQVAILIQKKEMIEEKYGDVFVI